MRLAAALAVAALVVIGLVEAGQSVHQIAEVAGSLHVTATGVGLTSLGLAASCLIYLALGWVAADDRRAVRAGVVVGVLAGIVGGTLRSFVIGEAVDDAVQRYVAAPSWFVPVALGIFVLASAAVSATAGAALAFIGARLRSGPTRRPGNGPSRTG